MVLGLAVNEAVGARAGAGGGGGGGAEATFLLPQALTASTTASATIIRIHRLLVSFNSSSSTFQREHSHQFMAGPKCDPSAPLSPASRRGSSSPFSARPERTPWLPGNYRRSGGCMSRRQLEMAPQRALIAAGCQSAPIRCDPPPRESPGSLADGRDTARAQSLPPRDGSCEIGRASCRERG